MMAKLQAQVRLPLKNIIVLNDDPEDLVQPKKASERSGRDKRRSYKPSFKVSVIHDVKSGMQYEEVAAKYDINRTHVLKWVQ